MPPVGKESSFAVLESLIVGFLILVMMLDFANYAGDAVWYVPPKVFYFPMFGVCAGLLLVSSNLRLARVRLAIVVFVAAYVAVNAIHAALLDGEASQIAWSRLQFIALTFVVALTATALARRRLAAVFAVCTLAIAVSILFDFLLPGVLYSGTTPGIVPGRVGGFFINPNKAGEAVVLSALLATPALGPSRAFGLLLVCGAAVLVTFSRAAMVAWVCLAGFYWWAGLLRRNQFLIGAALMAALVAGGGLLSLLVDSQSLPTVNAADIANRLNFLRTGDLHDDSGRERGFVLLQGLQVFVENPWTGAGTGATHLWSFAVGPHNQAVLMAAEYGIVGLAGWVGLILLVATGSYFGDRSRQLAATGFIILFSMSTHNLLDFPYWMMALFTIAMNYRDLPVTDSRIKSSYARTIDSAR
ncbi:MAG: O-antigen ligase family protein [Lautropia sp.]